MNRIFTITGPPCSGKTTLCKAALKHQPNVHMVFAKDFQTLLEDGELAAHLVTGHVLIECSTSVATQLKKARLAPVTSIYVIADALVLLRRNKIRAGENMELQTARLRSAMNEVDCLNTELFDYVLVNGDYDEEIAAANLVKILSGETVEHGTFHPALFKLEMQVILECLKTGNTKFHPNEYELLIHYIAEANKRNKTRIQKISPSQQISRAVMRVSSLFSGIIKTAFVPGWSCGTYLLRVRERLTAQIASKYSEQQLSTLISFCVAYQNGQKLPVEDAVHGMLLALLELRPHALVYPFLTMEEK